MLTRHQKRELVRIAIAIAAFAVIALLPLDSWLPHPQSLYVEFALFLIPYLIAGYDVIGRAFSGIAHGQVFDENFLMTIATFGAFALVFFPESEPHMAEGAAVMIFYQVGEWFQEYAVGKSRRSISELMDIAPDHANVMRGGQLVRTDPAEVGLGETIVVKPGERVPLDGVVTRGSSQLDTSALTGESLPQEIGPGDAIASGCINLTAALEVEVARLYSDSTVARILELVESASDRKARTESFITRFARWYTPIVVAIAVILAVFPPLVLGQPWSACVQSALVFLVVSCPCAIVISVPLSFFGGIGAASRNGILVKGSSYLETLASVKSVVFDKTGTLTEGAFRVVDLQAHGGRDPHEVLRLAAHAEALSDHPIAQSVRAAHGEVDLSAVSDAHEESGKGVTAFVDGHLVTVGSEALVETDGEDDPESAPSVGTVLYVAIDGAYAGRILIADTVKEDSARALAGLKALGVQRTVMLTGDREDVAREVAEKLGIDEFHARLLPADKIGWLERYIDERSGQGKVAFVGDGINDAPALMRADLGIAMGAMGSEAAMESADVVLMDDKPSKIPLAMAIARKTMGIARQNIVFSLAVKIAIMILALPMFGIANMWIAVFGDVGVACLAILNAMRTLRSGS